MPQNLGLACTDEGLLLGRTFLIERRDERFVVRARGEIERLLKCAYDGEPPVDRLMSGLARVASALNANDQCLARIAAVHLRMPDLASAAVRDGLAAEFADQIRPRRWCRELESGTASAPARRQIPERVRATSQGAKARTPQGLARCRRRRRFGQSSHELVRREIAEARVWTHLVVVAPPSLDDHLRLRTRTKPFEAQALVAGTCR